MLKLRNLEPGVWKGNVPRKSHARWRPTSKYLIEKYVRKQQDNMFKWLGGYKRGRSPSLDQAQHGYGGGGRHEASHW
jgi:hypothetical protein